MTLGTLKGKNNSIVFSTEGANITFLIVSTKIVLENARSFIKFAL